MQVIRPKETAFTTSPACFAGHASGNCGSRLSELAASAAFLSSHCLPSANSRRPTPDGLDLVVEEDTGCDPDKQRRATAIQHTATIVGVETPYRSVTAILLLIDGVAIDYYK
jgi:hypothetical protein